MSAISRSEARRAALLDAARDVFAGRGYHEARVSEIVERAGAAQGTFYLYFASKREAYIALVDGWLERFWEVLEDALREVPASPEDAETRMRASLTRVFEMVADDPQLARLVLKQSDGGLPEISERMETFRQRVAARLEATYLERQQRGLMRPFQARVIAEGTVGFLERVAYLWCVAGQEPPLQAGELAAEFAAHQRRGLARLE